MAKDRNRRRADEPKPATQEMAHEEVEQIVEETISEISGHLAETQNLVDQLAQTVHEHEHEHDAQEEQLQPGPADEEVQHEESPRAEGEPTAQPHAEAPQEAPAAGSQPAPEEKTIECPHCKAAIPVSLLKPTSSNGGKQRAGGTVFLVGTKEERAQKLAKSAPQMKAIVEILEETGKSELPESEARDLINRHKERLRTKQDPSRIFGYYKGTLTGMGVLRFS